MTDIGEAGTQGWRQGSLLRKEDGQVLATELGYEGGRNPVVIVVSQSCICPMQIWLLSPMSK